VVHVGIMLYAILLMYIGILTWIMVANDGIQEFAHTLCY